MSFYFLGKSEEENLLLTYQRVEHLMKLIGPFEGSNPEERAAFQKEYDELCKKYNACKQSDWYQKHMRKQRRQELIYRVFIALFVLFFAALIWEQLFW